MAQVTATINFYAYISGSWVLLNDTVGANPLRISWGISDNNPVSRVADIGGFSRLALDNSTGLYSPDGPSVLTGWKKGIPLKMSITYDGETKDYRYYISDIDAKSNNKQKKAFVTCVDWLDYAERHPVINPGIQTNENGYATLNRLLTLIEKDPQDTDFDEGEETFPTTFDTVTSATKAYDEFVKVALSELGWIYQLHDETLVFESSSSRHGWRTADPIPLQTSDSGLLLKEDGDQLLLETGDSLVLNETETVTFDGDIIMDFDAPYGEHMINRMTVYANPRRLSASAEILFQLDEEVVIGSGQTVVIKGTYADPNGGLPINAQDMITPVVTTDYTMFTATGGGGSNISASLTLVSVTYGTEGFTHYVKNTNSSKGYLNKYNCRGTGIFQYNPIEHAASNSASITEYETESESLNQKYKNDLYSGSVFVESMVDEHNQPRTVLNSITFSANRSSRNMMACLYTDIGNLKYISIPEAGIAGNYYIQGIELELRGGNIMCKWIVILALSLQAGLSPLAVEFSGFATVDAIDYGVLPAVYSDNTPQYITLTAWVKTPDGGSISGFVTNNGGIRFALFRPGGTPKLYLYSNLFDSGPGEWYSDAVTINSNQRYLVSMTLDMSSPANDPIIYLDGVAQPITETLTPGGSAFSRNGVPFMIGNRKTSTEDYDAGFEGRMFDVRVYNRILTAAELLTLYNNGTPDETLVTDGLVFQAFSVRTGNLSDYVDQTLTSTLTLRDNIFGAVGVPNGSPTGRTAP